MKFRPCIDIHNGKIKQIVGGSLLDQNDTAHENYVSTKDACYYAELYRKLQLKGGHVILLNGKESSYYTETKNQAILALHTFPKALQVGGGITNENALMFMQEGASHVIVTSYLFENDKFSMQRLEALVELVGKEHIVIDLSCRKGADGYRIMTNRWQTYTDELLTIDFLDSLSNYCDEFLIHAVDVEGMANGIEADLVGYLGSWTKNKITYAGGVKSLEDIELIRKLGNNRIDVTIGSALDLFGGNLSMKDVIAQIS